MKRIICLSSVASAAERIHTLDFVSYFCRTVRIMTMTEDPEHGLAGDWIDQSKRFR